MPPSLQEAHHCWAERLRWIFEVDPLRRAQCGHQMCNDAVRTQPRGIYRILSDLRCTATEFHRTSGLYQDLDRGRFRVSRSREPSTGGLPGRRTVGR